ncbi:MAG TPA: SWIM zinc finger family protein [Streptosporangiaceae bacterium]|nr:SWIM zinc finger family protein [Streptosporangiaceae bacterium]
MQTFSREQVLGLAPDASAAKAGQAQATTAKWPSLGRDEQAAWGECQGSGSNPYRCQAALDDGATKCSCPSRKFPCKHAIGLLLLLADGQAPEATRPAWVGEWLASRADRQEKQAAAPPGAPKPPADPKAQQRRAANRDKKVDAGIEELRRWLADLARGGLAAAQSQPWQWWDQMARRMIDAQARGLANRVRRLAEIAAIGNQRPDWPERMLDELGGLYLLCEAWQRRESLPPATTQALRSRIGYTQTTLEVLQAGQEVTDTWAVLGQRLDEDGQLKTLQQWLYGESSGEVVSYLAFAVSGQYLEPGLPPGARSKASLARYPGTAPHRVLILKRHDEGRPLGPLPGSRTWDEALSGVATLMAVDPWADLLPVAVRTVTVLPSTAPAGPGSRGQTGPWLLRDAAGRAVPIASTAEVRWRLLALSGGAPVDVAGEWDGFAFRPQAAALAGQDGQLIA